MTQNVGARYEITIDGKPRSYRDSKPIAIEAGRFLKRKNPNAKVGVRDLETGAVEFIPGSAHGVKEEVTGGVKKGGPPRGAGGL